jgi:plastocyanin
VTFQCTAKLLASRVLETGERFSHTFERAGTHTSYGALHPKMTGQVVVS